MKIGFMLIIAFILDLIFKDPKGIPHPVVMIGKIIKYGEISLRKIFRNGAVSETIAGTVLTLFVVIISFIVPYVILSICYSINIIFGILVEVFLCFQILALGSLKEAAMKVYTELSTGSLNGARKSLSHIVGRDTENLEEKGVVKATVESVAENTSDGVVAPLFYMLIGGASFGMLYKAVNTLDSMIGYKNKKYQYFGKVAARLDDILNIIPARITGFLYVLAALLSGFNYRKSYEILLRDRWNHSSPNSGYPEAAMSGALGIQLGGPASYFGEVVDKKYIGDDDKEPNMEDIPKACMLMTIVSVLALVLMILAKFAVLTIINYGL